ncbi:hypothetical protein PMKS-002063 [Pichia membranifaciens]|uniref:Uncharacterized protein n=1 Tax=Pichia membranifaciens TaxID=4926 RepID=A0A1Q2YGC1_9ASCO|nr:hypothetical protein PMKS-002063 [Pichia membranifaciens]
MPHPDNDMCMRPTHISHPPVSQLVAAHESHDNDELPAYEEIIRNTDEETKPLIETAYCADEKKAFDDNWELPAYEKDEKLEMQRASPAVVRFIAGSYVVIFLVTYIVGCRYMGRL